MWQLFFLFILCSFSAEITIDHFVNRIVKAVENRDNSHYFNYQQYKLHYLEFGKGNKAPLVIFPGMSEPAIKYWDLAEEFAKDRKVFVLDHIGHGFSSPVDEKNHSIEKLHITDFDLYTASAEVFLQKIIVEHGRPYLIAHSMGGQIAIQTLSKNSKLVRGLILSAPMFSIKLMGLPAWIVSSILYWLPQNNWIPGLAPVEQVFSISRVTHSPKYFQLNKTLNKKFLNISRIGPTVGWLYHAIKATTKTPQYKNFPMPILLLSPSNDAFVRREPHQEFCQKVKDCNFVEITDAKHEIFFESPKYRDKSIQAIHAFLKTQAE